MTVKSISAAEFDARFDAGEDISDYVDWSSARRLSDGHRPVVIDLTSTQVHRLDEEASKHGMTRHQLVEQWVAERLHRAA